MIGLPREVPTNGTVSPLDLRLTWATIALANGVHPRRGRGRLPHQHVATTDGPPEVVPVRLDPELGAAVDARATADDTTTSDIIREALRRFLHVA